MVDQDVNEKSNQELPQNNIRCHQCTLITVEPELKGAEYSVENSILITGFFPQASHPIVIYFLTTRSNIFGLMLSCQHASRIARNQTKRTSINGKGDSINRDRTFSG